MEPQQYIDAATADGLKIVQAVRNDNLDTDIEFIEGWTIRDLVAHLGSVWAFAEANVTSASAERAEVSPWGQVPDQDLLGWFGQRHVTMTGNLKITDPAQVAWTFAGAGTVAWWMRRMAYENAVHRWDVQAALGDPEPIDSDLGADSVDEYAEVSLRYSMRLPNRTYPAETLHLHRTDGPGEWMFMRGETEHEVVVTHEHGKGDAAVRASGSDLALWIRKRPVPADRLEIFGDAAVAEAWQALSP